MPVGTSLYFVRQMGDSMPVWEHHINGGTYQIKKPIEQKVKIQRVDRIWERVVFGVMSESMQEPMISAV